jgi:peptidoglycan/xylan/chitin deacetylase (PgdA/CDA1 family)
LLLLRSARLTAATTYQTWRATRRVMRRGFRSVGWRADARVPKLRAFLARGLTIFLFHEVTDSPSPMQQEFGIFTPVDLFTEQISWLRERFTVVKPTDLRQFGAERPLPDNAALVTFDDSWQGIFRVALPLLEEMGVPSISFLNMGTIRGDPELPAVRAYEELRVPPSQQVLATPVDEDRGARILAGIRERYAESAEFRNYQGPTVTPSELAEVASSSSFAWFGSHLYHHWDIRDITADLYERSLRENLEALAPYPNVLPVFATPYGYSGAGDDKALSIPHQLGYRVVMTVTGRQNPDPDAYVLDRLPLPISSSTASDWWHASHRLRLLGWALRE